MEYLDLTHEISHLLSEGRMKDAAEKCKAYIDAREGERKTREHFQKTANNPNCISTFTR
jgi:hypothetical protein